MRELEAVGERLGEIARSDPDARVRRVAIKRLDDAEALAVVAAGDPDPALCALATERLHAVLIDVAGSDRPVAECAAALARLDDERSVAAVASTAAHGDIRHAALARVAGDRALRDVVRAAADAAVRREALDRIHDPAVLRSIAVADGSPELALQALERIDDVEALRAIAEHRAAAKTVRQRARDRLASGTGDGLSVGAKAARARQLELSTLVHALRAEPDVTHAAAGARDAQREWQDLSRIVEPRDDVAQRFAAARDAILGDAALLARREAAVEDARTAVEESLSARQALCERIEALDGADALEELGRARAAWGRLAPLADERATELVRRFTAASEGCAARHRHWAAREAVHAGLATLVEEAEALADRPQAPKTKVWRALERRWTVVDSPDAAGDEIGRLRDRFTAAGERLQRRWQEVDQEQGERQRQNLARLETLCARLDELAQSDLRKAGAARRQLEAADAALADPGPLPAAERRAAWTERLTEARGRLLRRVSEVEETEEWRRWANTTAQEEIIQRVEALVEAGDLAEGTRQLGRLQQEWEQVATAMPDKSRALWERFRTARNELRKRCDVYLAENLEKKRALVAQVAGLGEATSWNETAELIKRVQAEWKEVGPVPGQHARGLWQQLREPCDRFFARRKEHFDRIDCERAENAQRKRALCEQAEALADSTDWDATAAAVKQLQAEWKRSGPPPRAEAEALWQRFRGACDRFFDRHRRRDELAREAHVEQARTLCDAMEALRDSIGSEQADAPEAVAHRIDELWAAWLRIDPATLGESAALDERLRAACDQIASTHPECLRGTRLDPEATRKGREKLCQRLDELVAKLNETPREMSLQEMALALRDRLASNTIAGTASGKAGREEAARELERVGAAWARLGPALGAESRALAERFDGARARARAALK